MKALALYNLILNLQNNSFNLNSRGKQRTSQRLSEETIKCAQKASRFHSLCSGEH